MPSGAKKRKAAKKKKEKETEINTNPSTTNLQGNDEGKSQDEKGSDGGEGGSPSHGDHDLAFNEEEEEREPSAAQPSDAGASKDLEAKIGETEEGKEGVVIIEWDVKSEESSESKDVRAGHVESAKGSHHGNGKSDSSSDETGIVKNSKYESHDSINETVAVDELVKSKDSLYAKVTPVTQNVLVEKTADSVAEPSNEPVKPVASVPEGQTIHNDNASLEKPTGSQVEATDLAVKKSEDEEHSITDQNVRTPSLEEPKAREFVNEVSATVFHSPIPESTLAAEHVKDSDAPESSENQPLVSSVPPVMQKTSWLSCCGLFDVVSGSNR
ncbi:hypothetical protein LR48_Vigan1529s000200 [Vigna angularis]|uniref:Uncharacterized protein n=2 Tax=Phaseolus angularis TaxID=3914 RepID=A0A0L9TJW5_PHAAN|nr:uncharacterized protein LOC108323529 [Vigna angularis]XP_017411498.1 uncharacterized protein LOC108323529 [Vigna angularis]XP_017411500.1 uncharacterized protein LOC108323529 [Vigna angularis]BAT79923.1 hypothetical protein VIGAN_02286400 [Vigna angularis var. angularis]KAG2398797.1 uncharacterized protein HKW66_Vig0087220 [Vigna angularis]KOM30424.1 hypothetical protein LR48_Vigan1529s000200 [Vigna angularis]